MAASFSRISPVDPFALGSIHLCYRERERDFYSSVGFSESEELAELSGINELDNVLNDEKSYIYINGIYNYKLQAAVTACKISNIMNCGVFLVYNESEMVCGPFNMQIYEIKLNGLIKSLINRVPTSSASCTITIFAHSHGAAITRKALSSLMEVGAHHPFAQRLNVVTFGAGAFMPRLDPPLLSFNNYLHKYDYVSILANTLLDPYLPSILEELNRFEIDQPRLAAAAGILAGVVVPMTVGLTEVIKHIANIPLTQPELAKYIRTLLLNNLSLGIEEDRDRTDSVGLALLEQDNRYRITIKEPHVWQDNLLSKIIIILHSHMIDLYLDSYEEEIRNLRVQTPPS